MSLKIGIVGLPNVGPPTLSRATEGLHFTFLINAVGAI